jgi:molybdopterin converting factor small subunit
MPCGDSPGPSDPSRRRLLKLIAIGAAGIGIAALGYRLMPDSPSGTVHQALAQTSGSESEGAAVDARIRVRYFQMVNAIPDVQAEVFVLGPPTTYGHLLAEVVDRHPAVSGMVPNMLVLVNGVAARPDTPLDDGDEVDFIPAIAGG